MTESTGIQLPLTPVKATIKSPKELIIFSKPKVGKTTLLAGLENCLILDFEDGSDYIDAIKLKVDSIDQLREIGKAIKDANYPYKCIAVDTVTALEEFCIGYAELLYSKSSMGKNWFSEGKPKYGTIINMPQGAGYQWLRTAYNKTLDYIRTLAPRIILVGHVKDTSLEKQGNDFNSLDLDLTGKIKRITASNSDAIGYLYRKGNQNILSFKTTDEISCGARPEHLRNKEIVLSEIVETENGSTVTTHWNKIYID
jgi:hypothetical protein